MAEDDETETDTPKKASRLPLILGVILALAGGAGSFFAIYSGMIAGGDSHAGAEDAPEDMALPDIVFVEVDPLVIGIGRGATEQHLRFRAQLEVPSAAEEEVRALLPRVIDVMNTYLRAVDIADLQDPSALIRLRAQLLRRVQVVAGNGRVRDLLVMEFIVT